MEVTWLWMTTRVTWLLKELSSFSAQSEVYSCSVCTQTDDRRLQIHVWTLLHAVFQARQMSDTSAGTTCPTSFLLWSQRFSAGVHRSLLIIFPHLLTSVTLTCPTAAGQPAALLTFNGPFVLFRNSIDLLNMLYFDPAHTHTSSETHLIFRHLEQNVQFDTVMTSHFVSRKKLSRLMSLIWN